MRSGAAAIALASLAGCAGGSPPIITPAPGPSIATVPSGPSAGGGFRPPEVQRETGLQQIIGSRPEELTRLFGAARIDLTEGDARKLQFANGECVLDVFLYPLEPNQAPIATHVEARHPQDGAAQDKSRCIAALQQ